jgi:DNA adenine methylase
VKTGLVAHPETYSRYFEPFLGGGAVFFSLRPRRGILSDVNPELMNFYEVLRDEPDKMRRAMVQHQGKHGTDHYYAVRESEPKGAVKRAARFLYLNRACFNGIYRVNRGGRFNVPKGSRQNVLFESDDYAGAARALKRMKLLCGDFEAVVDQAREGDFIFVDPPYTVKHNSNGFLRYNERIFSWQDQLRLRNALLRAATRGCSITVTNADHESVRALYRSISQYRRLPRPSMIAGQADMRGDVTEAVFTFNI